MLEILDNQPIRYPAPKVPLLFWHYSPEISSALLFSEKLNVKWVYKCPIRTKNTPSRGHWASQRIKITVFTESLIQLHCPLASLSQGWRGAHINLTTLIYLLRASLHTNTHTLTHTHFRSPITPHSPAESGGEKGGNGLFAYDATI